MSTVKCLRRSRWDRIIPALRIPYLPHVYESTHEVLVAECADGILGLFPCCVFHNPWPRQRKLHIPSTKTTHPHPYKTRGQLPNPSIQRPTTKIKPERPPSLHVGAHLRHSIRKQQHIGKEHFSSCKTKSAIVGGRHFEILEGRRIYLAS